jgi:hypothetical protein
VSSDWRTLRSLLFEVCELGGELPAPGEPDLARMVFGQIHAKAAAVARLAEDLAVESANDAAENGGTR